MTNKRATKPKATDWQNRDITDYNVSTYHAMLIDKNEELYGVSYQPFGKGAVSTRWQTEKGQLKQAQGQYGNAVLKRYIEICFAKHRFNPEYPCLSFGFMFAYMRNELAQAQAEIARESKRREAAEKQSEVSEIDSTWF
ncbi:hypothetical protein AB1K91_17660 [Terribacillus sp. 179-K 1B1 HS]|uniref:hypothetical protein n=1 Tax=Terribacillus sp. 179-K 1B1 HS TaxID=3142388 RepID=UPI0039A083D6